MKKNINFFLETLFFFKTKEYNPCEKFKAGNLEVIQPILNTYIKDRVLSFSYIHFSDIFITRTRRDTL